MRNNIHLYMVSKNEGREKIAITLMKLLEISTIEQLYDKKTSMASAEVVFLSIALIFGPFKIIDFAQDVIFFSFKWRPTDDTSNRNQEN